MFPWQVAEIRYISVIFYLILLQVTVILFQVTKMVLVLVTYNNTDQHWNEF